MKTSSPFDARFYDELLALALRKDGNPADAASSWISDATTLVGILAQNDLRVEPAAPRQVVAEVAHFLLRLARVLQDTVPQSGRPWSVADTIGPELDPADLTRLRALADRWGVTAEGAAISLLGDAIREVKPT
jgi:hypothetical protein